MKPLQSTMRSSLLPTVLVSLSLTLAFTAQLVSSKNIPGQVPVTAPAEADSDSNKPLRVAIIGAGAGGTSTAYFLNQLAGLSNKAIDITIYERADYIGGRSTILYPFDSTQYEPVEAGGSIFIPANKILNKAVDLFGLNTTSFGEAGAVGIWDGQQMVFQWSSSAELFGRYGNALLTLNSLTQTLISNFVSLYSKEYAALGTHKSIASIFAPLGKKFAHLPAVTASSFLINENSVDPPAVNEFVEGLARTNYGTGVGKISAMGGLISLAADGGVSVKGGNRQIFEQFAKRSGAKIHLGTKVESVHKQPAKRKGRNVEYVLTSSSSGHSAKKKATFDVLLLAAPQYASAELVDLPASFSPIVPQEYVHLYVTFVCTNSSTASPGYFGLPEGSEAPKVILSSFVKNGEHGRKSPQFNTLEYLNNLGPRSGVVGDVHVVKIFSAEPPTANLLKKVFPASSILWTHTLDWHAYPVLSPLKTTAPSFPPLKLGDKAWYSNALERLVSSMETETLAGWNVARSIVDEEGWTGWEDWRFASDTDSA